MGQHFTQCSWGRRIIALAAVYTLLVSGLLANFLATRAVALTAAGPWLAICHAGGAESPNPIPAEDGTHCVDNCSLGCLTLVMALPPAAGAVVAAVSRPADAPRCLAIAMASAKTRAHSARAPPPIA